MLLRSKKKSNREVSLYDPIGTDKEGNEITKFDYDFDLVSGRYVIDAKSIMGIFSLDLSKAIDLNIHAADAALDEILEVLKPYLV